MEPFNYSSKIKELINTKEKRKLLRELHASKKKLLYGVNSQAIVPFMHDRVLIADSKSLIRNYSPIASPPIKKQSNENYLEQMREHRSLIEKELQALRIDEESSRKDLERRLELLVTSHGAQYNATVTEIRTMLKSFNEARVGFQGDMQSNDPILRDLNILKTNYLLDGGQDCRIIEEIDSLMKEAERKKSPKVNDDIDWIRKRKDMVLFQEKSFALRNIELRNAELERQLELSLINKDRKNERNENSGERKDNDKIVFLQKQIEDLHAQIVNLKHPEMSHQRTPRTPVYSARAGDISDSRNIIISIDYISGIGQYIRSIGVILSVYLERNKIGNSYVAESIPVKRRDKSDLDCSVLLNIRHPVMNCPASPDVLVILELRVSKEFSNESRTEGWAKFNVFNDQGQLKLGKWQESIIRGPVHMNSSSEELLHQYHRSVVHYRLDHYSTEEGLRSVASSRGYDAQQKSENQSDSIAKNEVRNIEINSDDDKSDVTMDLDERQDLGLQMIRLKNMSIGDGLKLAKIRMTLYHSEGSKKGQIVMSTEGPVTCSTNAVRADFKISCYNLGRQVAKFSGVDLSMNCLIVFRFFIEGESKLGIGDDMVENVERLVAWTAIPAVKRRKMARRNPSFLTDSLKLMRINKGVHDIPLYEPPALPSPMVFFDRNKLIVGQKIIGRSKLKFRLFHTQLLNDSATSSDNTSPDEDDIPGTLESWIPVTRTEAPLQPYHRDGFDLYIDSGRLFPDSATFIKIEGGIVDRYLNYQGPQISTTASLMSDMHNPIFNDRIEVRDPHLSPSSTLLLKLLTIDREDRNLVVMGYASLKLFVETGSQQQPHFDNLGVLVSLNAGGHQVRIYQTEPTTSNGPFTESWFQKNKTMYIPAASLLLQIHSPARNAEGKIIDANETTTNYETQFGDVDAPSYYEKYFYSMDCKPTDGENKIMKSHMLRPKVKLQELMISKWGERLKEGFSLSDMPEGNDIYRIFNSINKDAFNFNHIAHYVPTHGFKISVDCALNLPWSSYPLAHLCLYPPGAIYMKKPLVAYDRPFFISMLDLDSTFSSPVWTDGWKSYRRRKYSKNMVAILHLHEMNISSVKNDFVFTLENQAWTPVRIFEGPYCVTQATQMPLLTGSPTLAQLHELTEKTVHQFLLDNIPTKKIIPLQSSSVIIRQCDSRRQLEISVSAEDQLLTLDQSFLPQANITAYRTIYESNKDVQFRAAIPAGLNVETLQNVLRIKFKNLIYKLYEQDGLYLS